jgi:hypothetical protein
MLMSLILPNPAWNQAGSYIIELTGQFRKERQQPSKTRAMQCCRATLIASPDAPLI